MSDEQTNEGDTQGKETSSSNENNTEDTGKHFVSSPIIEAAKTENDRREKIIEEEKKLQDRKEKLHAEQLAGGKSFGAGMMGQEEISEDKKKVNEASEFFKGTRLENDIRKANE